jgi:signal transduction histidine kinase
LLDFTRSKQTNKKPTNINDVIQETLDRLDKPEEIALSMQIDNDLPFTQVDPNQVSIILRNIIFNAIEAIMQKIRQESGGRITTGGELDIETRKEQGKVLVSIADNGIGIPKDKIDRIFDPLYTTKKEGIGLGMAIVRTLVSENDGEIDMTSKNGIGTTFTLSFPYIHKEENNAG